MAQDNRHQIPTSMSSAEATTRASTVGAGDSNEQHMFAPQARYPPVPLSVDPSLFAQGLNAPYPQPLRQQINALRQAPAQQPSHAGTDVPLSPIEFPEDPSLPGIAGSRMTLTGRIGQGLVQPRGENRHPYTYESVRNQLYSDNYASANFLTSTPFRLTGQPLWGQLASPFIRGAPLEDVPQNPAAANEYLDRHILWRPSAQLAGVPHPYDTARIRYYGNEVANALADVTSAMDRETFPVPYQRFLPVRQGGLWTWPRIVAIGHQVVGIAIRMHEVGTSNATFYDPAMIPTGPEEAMNFHERIVAFVNLVKKFKSCADVVMHQNFIEQYLALPIRTLDAKQRQLHILHEERRQRYQPVHQQTSRTASSTRNHAPMPRVAQHSQDRLNLRRAHQQPQSPMSPSLHPGRMQPIGSNRTSSSPNVGGFNFNDYPISSASAPVQQSPFNPPQDPHPTNPYYEAGYRPPGAVTQGLSAQPQQPGVNASWYNPAFGPVGTGNPSASQGQQLVSGLALSQAPSTADQSMADSAASQAESSRLPLKFDMGLEFLHDLDEQAPTSTAGK